MKKFESNLLGGKTTLGLDMKMKYAFQRGRVELKKTYDTGADGKQEQITPLKSTAVSFLLPNDDLDKKINDV